MSAEFLRLLAKIAIVVIVVVAFALPVATVVKWANAVKVQADAHTEDISANLVLNDYYGGGQ